MTSSQHVYEVRPRKDKRGVDLISDALPFGRLWYGEPNASSSAVDYAKFLSRSHNAVIRVYDDAGNVIETHEHAGDFKQWQVLRDQINREFVYRPFQFHKRSQLFICTHNETLSIVALPGENGFISTPEAIRQLTIAKKEQIEIQNQIARGERIPIDDVNEAVGQVFAAMRGIIKASLPADRANEVFDEMRRVADWLKQKANEVDGSNASALNRPTLRTP